MAELQPCNSPYCQQQIDLTTDGWGHVVKDDWPMLIFCDGRCLAVWCAEHAPTGFRAVRLVPMGAG